MVREEVLQQYLPNLGSLVSLRSLKYCNCRSSCTAHGIMYEAFSKVAKLEYVFIIGSSVYHPDSVDSMDK